ncbi:hypothetical protein SEA_LUCKYLEO_91 [Gordonia phage LuckyLeo]|nr:hypothetical protein SEA_LUCKYLEO_91 [Gordonia phage LuckyLeo]
MKEMERMDAKKIEIYTDPQGRVYISPEGKGWPWLIVEDREDGAISLVSRAVDVETKSALTKWQPKGASIKSLGKAPQPDTTELLKSIVASQAQIIINLTERIGK